MKFTLSKQEEITDSVPHYEACAFLNSVEAAAFNALTQVFDANTKVLAKVSLAELVMPPKTDRKYLQHWRRVQRRTIDFLICSAPTLKPVLAIKLETELDSKKRRASGPGIIEEVLGDIHLPLLRLKAQAKYSAGSLAKKINFTLKESQKPRPANSHESHEPQGTTTDVNNKLAGTARSAVNLWTGAKQKYRTG